MKGDGDGSIPSSLNPCRPCRTRPTSPMSPDGPFLTAAQVWLGHRAGTLDVARCGAVEYAALQGEPFVHAKVICELAHRFGDELLLWDRWGAMNPHRFDAPPDDIDLVDEIAALLIRADRGDASAERDLFRGTATTLDSTRIVRPQHLSHRRTPPRRPHDTNERSTPLTPHPSWHRELRGYAEVSTRSSYIGDRGWCARHGRHARLRSCGDS